MWGVKSCVYVQVCGIKKTLWGEAIQGHGHIHSTRWQLLVCLKWKGFLPLMGFSFIFFPNRCPSLKHSYYWQDVKSNSLRSDQDLATVTLLNPPLQVFWSISWISGQLNEMHTNPWNYSLPRWAFLWSIECKWTRLSLLRGSMHLSMCKSSVQLPKVTRVPGNGTSNSRTRGPLAWHTWYVMCESPVVPSFPIIEMEATQVWRPQVCCT